MTWDKPPFLITAALTLCALIGCERTPPVAIPATAQQWATASRAELIAEVPGFQRAARLRGSGPAWFFCGDGACAGGSGEQTAFVEGDEAWQAKWRAWNGPTLPRTHAGDADVRGRIDLANAIRQRSVSSPRSRELNERAARQAGALEFSWFVDDGRRRRLDARMVPRPEAPRFVEDLGSPRGAPPHVSPEGAVVAMMRLSVSPDSLWALARTVLSAPTRADFDRWIEAAKEELAIDLAETIPSLLTGHFFVALHDLDPDASLAAVVTGQASEETIWVGIDDPGQVSRLFGIAAQLSRGRFGAARDEPATWGWTDEEGALQWIARIEADYVVVTDRIVPPDEDLVHDSSRRPRIETLVEDATARGGLYVGEEVVKALAPASFHHVRWVSAVVHLVDGSETFRATLELKGD